MDHHHWGGVIVTIGILITAGGLLIYFTGWKWISWFGHLPGDIRMESGNSRVYIPIVSMLIVSIVLSLVLRLLR